MATYESSINVDMPLSSVYNQWTQFEEFPMFMEGVESVTQVTDELLHWCASISGVRREWDARITQQVPDQRIAWQSTEGVTIAGEVRFESINPMRTTITLRMDYEPESITEKAGDLLGMVRRRVDNDLENFKRFLEERGAETGEWRGKIEQGQTITLDEPDRSISLEQPQTEHAEYPTTQAAGPTPPLTPPAPRER
ncbi:MAG: SRPBCC family protein [Actinomycetota bacterium]|nr:SRPBCC family protein [Actinomycetota bacterium]